MCCWSLSSRAPQKLSVESSTFWNISSILAYLICKPLTPPHLSFFLLQSALFSIALSHAWEPTSTGLQQVVSTLSEGVSLQLLREPCNLFLLRGELRLFRITYSGARPSVCHVAGIIYGGGENLLNQLLVPALFIGKIGSRFRDDAMDVVVEQMNFSFRRCPLLNELVLFLKGNGE